MSHYIERTAQSMNFHESSEHSTILIFSFSSNWMASHIAATSGSMLLATGIYAYTTTGSLPSIVGSGALASFFFSAAYLIRKTDYQLSGHSLAAVAGTAALLLGTRRLRSPSKNLRIGPYALIIVGVMNVPYQFMKAYEWKQNQ